MSEVLKAEIEEEEREEFQFDVTDDEKAEWCLKKIREKQEELAMWEEHYKKQLDGIKFRLNGDIDYLKVLLSKYFAAQQEAGCTKKTKTQTSYALPTGKLVMKHQEPSYEVKDEELVPWLEKAAPEFVKVKKSADWASLKKSLAQFGDHMITEDGEAVPGVTVTPRPDIFKVEVK